MLEEFQRDGRARSVGVSNFQVPHLERLAAETSVVPAVNQVEAHPYFGNEEVRAYDREHNIITEAWSPIAQGKVLGDPTVVDIAEQLGRTRPRWCCAGMSARRHRLPEVHHPEADRGEFQIFDFELDDATMERITELDKERRSAGTHPTLRLRPAMIPAAVGGSMPGGRHLRASVMSQSHFENLRHHAPGHGGQVELPVVGAESSALGIFELRLAEHVKPALRQTAFERDATEG